MNTYYIPRNYKGEGRILFIFSPKALIYTCIGGAIGLLFYLIFKIFNLTVVGIIITLLFALIGFSIGTFKMPNINAFSITKQTGGESIDDILKRWIKFKKSKKKIYILNIGGTKDE